MSLALVYDSSDMEGLPVNDKDLLIKALQPSIKTLSKRVSQQTVPNFKSNNYNNNYD